MIHKYKIETPKLDFILKSGKRLDKLDEKILQVFLIRFITHNTNNIKWDRRFGKYTLFDDISYIIGLRSWEIRVKITD